MVFAPKIGLRTRFCQIQVACTKLCGRLLFSTSTSGCASQASSKRQGERCGVVFTWIQKHDSKLVTCFRRSRASHATARTHSLPVLHEAWRDTNDSDPLFPLCCAYRRRYFIIARIPCVLSPTALAPDRNRCYAGARVAWRQCSAPL